MKVLTESIHQFSVKGGYTIRLWKQEGKTTGPKISATTIEKVRMAVRCNIQPMTRKEFLNPKPVMTRDLAEALIELPNINAVEVKDDSGFGVVLYKNWP